MTGAQLQFLADSAARKGGNIFVDRYTGSLLGVIDNRIIPFVWCAQSKQIITVLSVDIGSYKARLYYNLLDIYKKSAINNPQIQESTDKGKIEVIQKILDDTREWRQGRAKL